MSPSLAQDREEASAGNGQYQFKKPAKFKRDPLWKEEDKVRLNQILVDDFMGGGSNSVYSGRQMSTSGAKSRPWWEMIKSNRH